MYPYIFVLLQQHGKFLEKTLITIIILFQSQNNTGQTGEPGLFLDINVMGAWMLGYTGRGIVVGVIDDGMVIQYLIMC